MGLHLEKTMSEEWKKQDRSCPPCPDCGTALYEKFLGNGGWVLTEMETSDSNRLSKAHEPSDCVRVLRAKFTRFIAAYESMRRRFGGDYAGWFVECDELVKRHDETVGATNTALA
jgi:hypothetical protein